MKIIDFPVEIIQQILGNVSFVDLPHLLKSSKAIDVFPLSRPTSDFLLICQDIYKGSTFNYLHQFIPADEKKEIHSNMAKFQKCWSSWTVEQVLTTYVRGFCQQVIRTFQ
jgi:hypothetical protein